MTKLFSLILVLVSATGIKGQTTAEWTQQDETQIKYLIEQISAFQTYLGYVKKGYDIAHKGLTTVQKIKNGEWNLHKDFFGSLKNVNPSIAGYAKVADIVAMQIKIVKRTKALINQCGKDGQFTNQEIGYLETVCDNLLTECLKNLDELMMVITSGELEMKDNERIKRIEQIYADMQDKQTFLVSFGNKAILLSKQRQHEQNEIFLSEKLNAVK